VTKNREAPNDFRASEVVNGGPVVALENELIQNPLCPDIKDLVDMPENIATRRAKYLKSNGSPGRI
jgi:hypothetical protein